MFRVLMFLTMSVLATDAVAKAPPSDTAPGASMIIKGPVFHYSLKENKNPSVCKHMLKVFNDRFTHLWDAPRVENLANSPEYSANGRYAFPLLPGVKYSAQATYHMRFSAQPTSPEFSAIHWQEGMAIPGGCPAGKKCAGEGPEPILVAYYDFDNDGSIDTVIKQGSEFFPGYERMSWAQEYLMVWRGQKLKISGIVNMWNLAHSKDRKLEPIMMQGVYLRPFIYHGVSYVASYRANFAPVFGPAALNRYMPPYPIQEDILIERPFFADRRIGTIGAWLWNTDTICDLQMQRLSN